MVPADGRAARPGARDRAPQPRPAARATRRLRRPRQLDAGLTRCWRASAASRWSTPPAAPFRTCRAWTPARSRPSASAASRSCPRAISCSGSRPAGTQRAMATPPRGADRAVPGQGPGVRAEAARGCATACRSTEFDIQQLMAGWFGEEGPGRAIPHPIVAAEENAGQSALPADRGAQPSDRCRRALCCSTSGASSTIPARCTRTSRGWASPGARCPPTHGRGRSPRSATPVTRPSRSCRTRARAGDDLRGWQVDRAAREVLEEAGYGDQHPAPHRAQPGRGGPRQRREHGRLRDARRPARCSRAPGSRSSRASISTPSACGPRSTWSVGERDAVVTGVEQAEIVPSVTVSQPGTRGSSSSQGTGVRARPPAPPGALRGLGPGWIEPEPSRDVAGRRTIACRPARPSSTPC